MVYERWRKAERLVSDITGRDGREKGARRNKASTTI